MKRLAVDPAASKNRGGDRRSEEARSNGTVPIDTQQDRAETNGVSHQTQRYLDHLARDRPDLLEQVEAGRLRPKTAARQAGLVKVGIALKDEVWGKGTDREVARLCGVTHPFVGCIRASLVTVASDERTYTTKHGTTATMKTLL